MARYRRWRRCSQRLCFAQELGSVPGGTGSFDRRGISMAFRKGFRRRIADGARIAVAARRVTGLMTTARNRHTLPFLISNFHVAMLVA